MAVISKISPLEKLVVVTLLGGQKIRGECLYEGNGDAWIIQDRFGKQHHIQEYESIIVPAVP